MDTTFWKGKRVFLTGHTGFKGAWLSYMLTTFGAELTGYSLEPPTNPSLFHICRVENNMHSVIGDIRDISHLQRAFQNAKPEIVVHMAAQPIVRTSYTSPAYTYDVNVMGTVNLLECLRLNDMVKSFLNVTTDKVYHNNEWEWGYRETDPLNGFDPYSNSKSCSELVTHSYNNSFFTDKDIAISTARSGNVIGGGDFALDRIIPDCIRAIEEKKDIVVRNPYSTRPYQHVLESLFAYAMIIQQQYLDKSFAGYYNVGPDDCDCVSTGTLVDMFCKAWGDNITWNNITKDEPHEANFLKLDCSKIKAKFGWKPSWNIGKAIDQTVEWTRCYLNKNKEQDINEIMNKQINQFITESENYNV